MGRYAQGTTEPPGAASARQLKLLPQDGELYVFAQCADRVAKDRAMRRRQQPSTMRLTRGELLMKLGAARHKTPSAWRLIKIDVSPNSAMFSYRLDRNKLRLVRWSRLSEQIFRVDKWSLFWG